MINRALLAAVAYLTVSPVSAEEIVSFGSAWNLSVQLTAERNAKEPTADVASPAWLSADWVLEPAPAQPGSFYIRNRWRETYLTYVEGVAIEGSRSNVQLMPKYDNPANNDESLLALGQTWVFEKSPISQFIERIRTAHHGFGKSYLTISSRDFSGAEQKRFREPHVSSENSDDFGAMWVRFKSSRGTQEQCVKNMSGTVFDVDWYFGRDVNLVAAGDKLALVPKHGVKPQLSERKTLFFESCETSDQRMVASVQLVGKEAVSTLIALPVTLVATSTGLLIGNAAGAAAGYLGGVALGEYLVNKPNTVYIGAPGKITIKGTLYDATAEEDEPLLR